MQEGLVEIFYSINLPSRCIYIALINTPVRLIYEMQVAIIILSVLFRHYIQTTIILITIC